MASIFTKIIQGDIPSHKVAENEDYLAFLDIRPLAKGHTLVIPKEEIDYLFDLSDERLAGLMAFAKRVAKGLEATVTCKRVGVMVIGTEVPHAHVHLVPFQQEAQIDITRKPIEMSQEAMAELATQISANVEL
jgi:histidine triad (HIT) family protein